MGHREVIETGYPRVELSAVRQLKGDMMKARPQRFEGIARAARMAAHPVLDAISGGVPAEDPSASACDG